MQVITLKNTFLSIDFRNPSEESANEFEAPPTGNGNSPLSRCAERCSDSSSFASPLRRTKSAECLSPWAPEFSQEVSEEIVGELQIDRLNTLVNFPLRPAFAKEQAVDPFCVGKDWQQAVLSPDSVVLRRSLTSYESVSTMAPSVSSKEYSHKNVPRYVDLEEQYRAFAAGQVETTLMIRNIPNRYSQSEFVEELVDLGLGGGFDFVYLPLDRSSRASVGYAFVNFISHSWAQWSREILRGHRFQKYSKSKTAVVSTAHLQGLEANLAHYEKSAVSKTKFADHKPLVIADKGEVLPPPR